MNLVNGGSLGVNVWWTCPEVAIDAKVAQSILVRHGFDKSLLPTPSRKLEVSRAAHSFQDRRGKESRRVTEKVYEDAKHITYGIVALIQVGDSEVGGRQVVDVRLNKDTDEVLVRVSRSVTEKLQETQDKLAVAVGDEAKELAKELVILQACLKTGDSLVPEVRKCITDYEGKITDEDIRYFLRRIITRCFGIAKRPSGGIYFIPEDRAQTIRDAQAVLEELWTRARIYVEGVINGVEERKNVWQSVEEEIDGAIAEALKATSKIEKSTKSVKSQRMKLDEMEEIVEVYQKLLGEEAKHETLVERIEDAARIIEGKMKELQAA